MTESRDPVPGLVNPVIRQRADPDIYRHSDGYYYFMATVPEYDRLELRRAITIPGLATAEAKVIWRQHPTGIMGSHIWAPEIHFINGRWYVYFAAGGAEKVWDIRIYVLENPLANPLEGEWVEKGQLKTNWESFSLDATTFVHGGVNYLVWGQKDPQIKGNTNLYIARMDTPWSITGPQVMLSHPEFPWEQQKYWVNEGPAVLQKNGRIFITYSASGTDYHYCMGLLTADEKSDPRSPVLDEIARAGFRNERGEPHLRTGTQQFHHHTRRPDRFARLSRAQLPRDQGRPLARSKSRHARAAAALESGRHA